MLRLILLELRHRLLSSLLSILSVAIAVAAITGVLLSLRAYDARTEQLAAQRQKAVEHTMEKLQEDFRKLTLKMGFTTVIVHKSQSLPDLFALGYATVTMPEAYGDKLAAAKVSTINHVLPTLQKRMPWPEQNNRVIQLIGVKGEVYIQSKNQLPLLEKVPDNSVVIGQQLQKALNLQIGDSLTFHGKKLTISAVRPGRGGPEDVGLWIPLPLAQEILNLPAQINAIMAVECMCPGDRVAVIQREINSILPDAQVFEFVDVASARSEARNRVNDAARSAADQEIASRKAGRREKELLTSILVPAAAAATFLWIAFLLFSNVRDRRAEIGLFRALGVRSLSIATLFLGKALALAAFGALLGYPLGLYIAHRASPDSPPALSPQILHMPFPLALFLGTLAIAALAAVLPALLAARQNPADMLREQ